MKALVMKNGLMRLRSTKADNFAEALSKFRARGYWIVELWQMA